MASAARVIGWLATVDHKEIGRRYIFTALGFLAAAGLWRCTCAFS